MSGMPQRLESPCPCGCSGTVKPGNRYASAGCYSRATLASAKARRDVDDGASLDRASIVQRLAWCRANNPRTSWWAGCATREEFRRRLAARLPLMGISEFGRGGAALATAPDVQLGRRRVPAADVEGL